MITIYTIGHSTKPWADFIALLHEHTIRLVADVRRYPQSQKFPQFNRDALASNLALEEIGYIWLEALGGLRRRAPADSPNRGLLSLGFRNYADHMLTGEFRGAVEQLLAAASQKTTAILCAERLYWKCHRRLLSDYLVSRGVEVLHIEEKGKIASHQLTPKAALTPRGVTDPNVQSR